MKGLSTNAYESWSLNQVNVISNGTSFDISQLVQSVVIDEDMERGLVRGTVAFIDSMNLMETFEMKGQEYLFLSFNSLNSDLSDKEPYAKLFRISSYIELSEQNLGTKRAIELHLCNPAEIYNELCTIRKSYKNASSSQVVREMLEILQVDMPVQVEETLFMKDMIMPGITPLEVIAFMGNYSMSKETGDANFYFFENRNGIHFTSGVKLISQEPFEFIVEGTDPSDLSMYRTISNYQKPKGFDIMEQIRSGAVGLNMIMRDGLRKGYKEQAVTFDAVKAEFPMLNAEPAILHDADVNNATQKYITVDQMYQFNDKSSYGNMSAIRQINRASLSTKRSFVETAGDSDISVGEIVDLKISDQKGQASVRDSGKWLVLKVRHIINPTAGSYRQEMVLTSDSNIIRDKTNVPGV